MLFDKKFFRLAKRMKEYYLFNHKRTNVAFYKIYNDCCLDLEAVLTEYKMRMKKTSSQFLSPSRIVFL